MVVGKRTESCPEALAIDRAQLIEHDGAALSGEPTRHAKGAGLVAWGPRCHDARAEVVIQLVGRDDPAGSRFPDLTLP